MSARIIPERIREARESVGMSDEQFADAIGVTRQSVGTYETRAFAPRGDVFSKIIAVTRQPPGFFTTPRKHTAERFLTPTWRSLKRMQRPDRLRVGRRLEWAFYIAEFWPNTSSCRRCTCPPSSSTTNARVTSASRKSPTSFASSGMSASVRLPIWLRCSNTTALS